MKADSVVRIRSAPLAAPHRTFAGECVDAAPLFARVSYSPMMGWLRRKLGAAARGRPHLGRNAGAALDNVIRRQRAGGVAIDFDLHRGVIDPETFSEIFR
jgi:hypothetical protein